MWTPIYPMPDGESMLKPLQGPLDAPEAGVRTDEFHDLKEPRARRHAGDGKPQRVDDLAGPAPKRSAVERTSPSMPATANASCGRSRRQPPAGGMVSRVSSSSAVPSPRTCPDHGRSRGWPSRCPRVGSCGHASGVSLSGGSPREDGKALPPVGGARQDSRCSSELRRRYCVFIQASFSRLNTAPDFPTRSRRTPGQAPRG